MMDNNNNLFVKNIDPRIDFAVYKLLIFSIVNIKILSTIDFVFSQISQYKMK